MKPGAERAQRDLKAIEGKLIKLKVKYDHQDDEATKKQILKQKRTLITKAKNITKEYEIRPSSKLVQLKANW